MLSGIFFAIVTRVIIPFDKVFTDHGIVLNTPDAYIMVRYADTVPNYPLIDYFSRFPEGAYSLKQSLFPFILAIISNSLNVSNYMTAAVLPVILFFLTLVAAYTIAKILFDERTAALAVFILCLLPGEILNRTSLGAGDYHCWETFLVANIIMIIIVAMDSHTSIWKILLWVEAAILFVIYYLSWAGALLMPAILTIAIAIIIYFRYCKTIVAKQCYILVIMGLAAMALRMKTLTAPIYTMLFVGMGSHISEENPLFFTFGKFDMAPMIAYFGITFYLVLAGIGWLAYRVFRHCKSTDIIFLSWAIMMLFLTICMRRFDYYLAVPAAIIISYVIIQVVRIVSKQQIIRLSIVIAIVCCLPLAKQSIVTATSDYGYANVDWIHTCEYLREQNDPTYEKAYLAGDRPSYGVLSGWSYGYWLMCIGHQAVYTNSSAERQPEDALILSSTSTESSVAILRELSIRYVVVCQDMLKSHGLSTDNLEQTFMYKAYYQQINDLYLVCQYGDVKTFEIKEAIK
jgi:asparagine N-glycosylation enzyme membrane subunit Stt3